MAEILTLTTPITPPSTTTYRVRSLFMDPDAPAIKTEFLSNLGETVVWRYVVSDTVTAAQIRVALSFINQGKFMSIQGKSLQRFLIDEAQSRGVLGAGSVSGTVD